MEMSRVSKTKRANVKVKGQNMLICFSDIKGIINYKFVPPKQSTKQSTVKFYSIYGSAFIGKDQFFGRTSGFLHLPTQHLTVKQFFT
jgi:hypothetical protein